MAKKTKTIKITQVKSSIRRSIVQKRTLEALGLRRMHQTVEHKDSPQLQGMLNLVHHMVRIDGA